MIHVIATIEVHQGQRGRLLDEFQELVPLVRAERGCVDYGPTIDVVTDISAQDTPRPDVVTVVEKWDSLEALRAHLTAPHMGEFRSRVSDIVAGIRLQILEPA